MLREIKFLFSHLDRTHLKDQFIVGLYICLAALTELMSLFLLPLLVTSFSGGDLVLPKWISICLSLLMPHSDLGGINKTPIILVALILVIAMVALFKRLVLASASRYVAKVALDLSQHLYRRILLMSFERFSSVPAATYIALVNITP